MWGLGSLTVEGPEDKQFQSKHSMVPDSLLVSSSSILYCVMSWVGRNKLEVLPTWPWWAQYSVMFWLVLWSFCMSHGTPSQKWWYEENQDINGTDLNPQRAAHIEWTIIFIVVIYWDIWMFVMCLKITINVVLKFTHSHMTISSRLQRNGKVNFNL